MLKFIPLFAVIGTSTFYKLAMRRSLAVFLIYALSFTASANESETAAKPIKPATSAASAAEAASVSSAEASSEKGAALPEKKLKETSAQKKLRLKDEKAAEELAAKIAESLANIRKNRPTSASTSAAYAAAAAAASIRSKSYVAPVRRPMADANPAKSAAPANAANKKAEPIQWSYEGEGAPENWSSINPLFNKCENGTRQSPIDIHDGIKVELDPLNIDYKSSGFSVVDNGHTISVTPAAGNVLNVSGRDYELAEFHFHRPSEESINGKRTEMVVHLVHKDTTGKIAVIAALLEVGDAHPIIQQVWNNLPLEKGDTVKALNPAELRQLLPEKLDYYTYMGSLTTPPCSEGVLWIVLKQTMHLSADQLAIFARLYPMNARPVQPLSGRMIKESQ